MQLHTIKEVADTLNLSKVAVTNKLKELQLYDQLITDGNRKLIPLEVEEELLNAYKHRARRQTTAEPKQERRTRNSTANDEIIAILREQLQAKDRLIENLTEQNAELTKAIRESHQLQLMLSGTVSTAEDVTTEPTEEPQPQPKPKRHWWNR